MKEIKTVGFIGMGALGLLYANQIADGLGQSYLENVCFIMDSKRVAKYRNEKFTCNGKLCNFSIKDNSEVKPLDLIIVAVKYNSLNDAIKIMENAVGKDTIIISVLNGITSEKIIAETYGMDHIVYTVAQGMDAMKFGNALTYTKAGELHIGESKDTNPENVLAVKNFFEKASMPYVIEKDIIVSLWKKFMLNVGVNQTCMVFNATYSKVLEENSIERLIFISAMREVLTIAKAENIILTEEDVNMYVKMMGTLKPDGTPSMGQDRINKKPSEVEMFAGTVIKIAKKHNIQVPVNEYLYEQVKKLEKEYCYN